MLYFFEALRKSKKKVLMATLPSSFDKEFNAQFISWEGAMKMQWEPIYGPQTLRDLNDLNCRAAETMAGRKMCFI